MRQAKVTAARNMIARAREHHDLWPARLAADTAYGSAEMLDWLVHDQGIEPHIPVIDKSERIDGTFSRSDFTYGHAADLFRCPGSKELKQYRRAFRADHPDTPPDNTYRYRARKMDCDACALNSRCRPNAPARKVTRSIHEGARDFARDIAKTDGAPPKLRSPELLALMLAYRIQAEEENGIDAEMRRTLRRPSYAPSFGYGRGGKVYRYYVSSPLQKGNGSKLDRNGVIRRVTAEAIHEVICNAVGPSLEGHPDTIRTTAGAIRRIEVLAAEVQVVVIANRCTPTGRKGLAALNGEDLLLTVPVRCKSKGGRVEQVLPAGSERKHVKRDPTLIRGLQQAHQLAKLMGWRAGDGSLDGVLMKQPDSAYERKLVRLAF